jgi:hypothetical protein
MERKSLPLIILMLFYGNSAQAGDWSLISDDDFARDRVAPHIAQSFEQAPDGPSIEVVQPTIDGAVAVPITIRLRWRPKESTTIDLSSFRVSYGWIELDVTKEIREHAEITQDGLLAKDAKLPSGNHRMTVEIADNLHHLGMRTFEFTVK